MSERDSSVISINTPAKPFGSDSGSEYLPTSNRRKRKRYSFSKYKMISETNATTSRSNENTNNDKTETVGACDSGNKRKKTAAFTNAGSWY